MAHKGGFSLFLDRILQDYKSDHLAYKRVFYSWQFVAALLDKVEELGIKSKDEIENLQLRERS